MINIDDFRLELENDTHWEEAYDRFAAKPNLNEVDFGVLYACKTAYKNDIIASLLDGTYHWSVPRKVLLSKHGTTKKRTVYIYELKDRYVLGVLYRALSAYCKELISDRCFSYKKNVCTSTAIKYIIENRKDELVGVKVDIHAYFNSVSKEKLNAMIDELFCDGLKTTMQSLLCTDKVRYNGKIIEEYKALIPGCALGSFFANYTLRECDQYFDDNNILYARYSDDIIILANSEEQLTVYLNVIKHYLAEYGLVINEKKYKWFKPGDEIDFLGLKITDQNRVDISDHGKQKIKKQIHRWCKKGRVEIEKGNITFDKQARNIIKRFNYKNFKCYLQHDSTFGWCHYAFRYINCIDSLRELDFYMKDTLRAMKTGKHNKANARYLNDEELKELGWVSLVELYKIYRFDFDYYCEIIELF